MRYFCIILSLLAVEPDSRAEVGDVMSIEALNTAARAAGFAMAGSDDAPSQPAQRPAAESREVAVRTLGRQTPATVASASWKLPLSLGFGTFWKATA